MTPISTQCRAVDARGAPRESLYVPATLYCDGSPSPVRICDMSVSGALVEGASLPSVGSVVQLIRGSLIVHGIVVWSTEDRRGLKFSGGVDIEQWRATTINSEQQRVDEIVRLVKAGAVPLPVPALRQNKERHAHGGQLSEDLQRVSHLLEDLGAVLASDPDVVTQYGSALQNLDIAMQIIAAIEKITSGDSTMNADATKLLGLRRSADQALQQRA